MADLAPPAVFSDGQTITAALLNAHVSGASVLTAFLSSKPLVTPVTGDSVAIYQASQDRIARCTVSDLTATIPTDAAANVGSLRTLGTTALSAASGIDSRFPTSITGVRKGNGAGVDTAAGIQDFNKAATNITGTNVDWSLNNVFWKDLSAPVTLVFTNLQDGQTILIAIKNNSFAVTWPATTNAVPTPTVGSVYDLWTVTQIGSWKFIAVKSF